ncbi:family 16 glycosylhydrolase [Shewanella sp. NIFS-20-20]|uniref:family 16 glycosylhydrolase n=1 Tax=Shewanella sp. NIFS-20-20 TaxID=2853806 RepID=UPI001C440114|nr:family 16 glycosylhydrolase [Shewanella sp. NIFS-20-20]MBV7314603.1 family 16 glycosylhydrolase [Shewanella sp. NIFS-20-20]
MKSIAPALSPLTLLTFLWLGLPAISQASPVPNLPSPITIFEDFDTAGQPEHPGVTWRYRAQLAPVSSWQDIIPGDGFAYLRINGRHSRLMPEVKWPFQMLIIDSIGPNQSITIRAKHITAQGVASFIFTYSEYQQRLDEIDLEITAIDSVYGSTQAAQSDQAGQASPTQLRMNVWTRAPLDSDVAQRSINQAIKGSQQQALSHDDDEFHLYQLDWYESKVEFFIDGVKQGQLTGNIPRSISELNIGVRHMAWTGELSLQPQVVIIDWVNIRPLVSHKTNNTP